MKWLLPAALSVSFFLLTAGTVYAVPTIQLISGSLTVSASSSYIGSPTDNFVTNSPPPVLLTPGSASATLSATANAAPPYYSNDIHGSATGTASVGTTAIELDFSGFSSDSLLDRTISGGSATLDVTFSLIAPTILDLHAQTSTIWAFANDSTIDQGTTTIAVFPDPEYGPNPADTIVSLPAGTYELTAIGAISYNTGTGGPGSGIISAAIVPEPAAASLAILLTAGLGRRRTRS